MCYTQIPLTSFALLTRSSDGHGCHVAHDHKVHVDEELRRDGLQAKHRVHDAGEQDRHGQQKQRVCHRLGQEVCQRRIRAGLALAQHDCPFSGEAVDRDERRSDALVDEREEDRRGNFRHALLVVPQVLPDAARDEERDDQRGREAPEQQVPVAQLLLTVASDQNPSLAGEVSDADEFGEVELFLAHVEIDGHDVHAALFEAPLVCAGGGDGANKVLGQGHVSQVGAADLLQEGVHALHASLVQGLAVFHEDEVIEQREGIGRGLVDRADHGALPAVGQVLQGFAYGEGGSAVQPGGGLVQEDELGVVEQLDCNAQTLALAAGDALAAGVADDGVLAVPDAHQLGDLLNTGRSLLVRALLRHSQLGCPMKGLADRKFGVKEVILHHVGRHCLQYVGVVFTSVQTVLAGHIHGKCIETKRQGAQESCLPTSRRACIKPYNGQISPLKWRGGNLPMIAQNPPVIEP
jgi:hypothetical protein